MCRASPATLLSRVFTRHYLFRPLLKVFINVMRYVIFKYGLVPSLHVDAVFNPRRSEDDFSGQSQPSC